MGKTYWMLVTDQQNFNTTLSRGFGIQGVDSYSRRKAVRMTLDDRMIYYLADRRSFAATATVASSYFEDHERIWTHHRERENFPHRVKVRPDIVLDVDLWMDATQIAPSLEYVKKWAPEDWPLAFSGMLHIIPQRDFTYLEDEMRRLLKKFARPELPPTLHVEPRPAEAVLAFGGTPSPSAEAEQTATP